MEKDHQFQLLLQKYIDNTINKVEYDQFLSYFSGEHEVEILEKEIMQQLMVEPSALIEEDNLQRTIAKVDRRLDNAISRKHNSYIRRIIPYAAAAAMLLLLGIGSYYFIYRAAPLNQMSAYNVPEEVDPGTNQAKIVLPDGTKYLLKDEQNGVITDARGIHYSDGIPIVEPTEVITVSLETPRGGQYRITLPDGTKVFMNSNSQLRYPVQFKGDKREVELKGEAYFEVVHNKDKPFIVRSGEQQIRVLGTKFNINSFEAIIATTLVEGRVSVQYQGHHKEVILQPGQQSRASKQHMEVQKVLTDDYIGWTQNLFVFNDMPLTEIMKQLERWYDVDTDFPISFKDEKFFAEIPRDRKLSQVLQDLEKAGNYKFEIQGRRIIVR